MAVSDKNFRCMLGNETNEKSSLEAKLFPNTGHLQWATWLRPKNENKRQLQKTSGKQLLPSKVESTLTCLGVHQRRGESRLDYLKAERLQEGHVLLWGERGR